jgi:hypothetical protein
MVCAVVVLGSMAVAVATTLNDPVVYLPFNGSTDDASGHANHAVAVGATPTADRFGNLDAAYLVGAIGHLEVADHDSLDMSDDYSVSLWFRQDDMISSKAVLLGKGVNTAYSVYVYYDDSYVCPDPLAERAIQVSVGGATSRFASGPFFDCGIDEWRHVVVTVRTDTGGNQTALLYVEGVYEGTLGMSGDFENNTSPVGIGKDGETSNWFVGAVDDVRLFDRELTADEAAELFNSIFIDGFESGSLSSWMSSPP